MNAKSARADLHLHSKFSARAADWLSRRLDFPASCSEPRELYAGLKGSRSFDFFTLTDHNTIDGCLEVAGLPGVFISEELTTHFPEDGCKVHLLVYGITDADHAMLQNLRPNIYDVQACLAERRIAHCVAHPLQSPDEKLTAIHLQKLVLLFRNFEVINGKYPRLASECIEFVLRKLTPERVARMAEDTGLAPTHEEPWRKAFFGGSDDAGEVFAGAAWTQTPPAETAEEFLKHLREGRTEAMGECGRPLLLAHGAYSTAFQFAKKKLHLKPQDPGAQLLEKICSRFLEGKDPTEFTLGEKLGLLMQGVATGKIFDMARAGQNSLWKELAAYFSQPAMKAALARVTAGIEKPERRSFLMADLIAGQLSYRLFSQCIQHISAGRILESIQMIAPVLPLAALLAPYLQAFRQPKRGVLQNICLGVCGELPPALENRRRAWFTDTLEEINGVSTTIKKMAAAGAADGFDITVVTSRSELTVTGIPLKNFPPIGEFALPEYELQQLSFPPVLRILDWVAEEEISEIIISTPGPIGLAAALAAELLGLPSVSIYHTDFPQYVGILTDDSFMETLTWNYMQWFFSRQELVYVNSEDYRRALERRGIPAGRLRILPRGLDTALFHPTRRKRGFWAGRGLLENETGVLFVGRISKEKNLDMLVAASRELDKRAIPVRFLFVGDGPYLSALKEFLPDAIFTGSLAGEELATAYASADMFAFPSTTDTFGNVIIEAQASGLPCIVSNLGGPRDLVTDGADGMITRALDVGALVDAIETLAGDAELRRAMGARGRARVESRDWHKAFAHFWNESSQPYCA